MPRIERRAQAVWQGRVEKGAGTLSGTSSSAFSLPYTFASRVAAPEGKTSPEELLAAAHAGCFSMSVANELGGAGHDPVRIDVRVTSVMDEVPGQGHQIVGAEVDVTGAVPGIDEDTFQALVRKADEGCPFSTLVRAVGTVTVTAALAK